jgi:MtrB/PioB family decaheme-associated outer membrane protein
MKVIKSMLIFILFISFLNYFVLADEAKDNKIQVTGKVITGAEDVKEDARSSKFYEYRDIPRGFIFKYVELSLMKDSNYFKFEANRIRQSDANYLLSFGKYGKYSVNLEWDKTPHRFSYEGKMLYIESQPGIYTLADQIQYDAQNAASITSAQKIISSFLTGAHDVELALYRHGTKANFTYNFSEPLTFNFDISREKREGARPFGASFGFNHAVEVPEPIDYRTTNLDASIQYNKKWGSVRAGVYFSSFENEISSLTWDNYYRATDRTYSAAYINGDGTSTGQLALPPSNSANKFYVNASFKPYSAARISGSFSYGTFSQDEALLPYTVNTAIGIAFPEALTPPANSAQAKANVSSLNLTFFTKVIEKVNFDAGVRYYNFDNKTHELELPGYVRFDQVWEEEPLEVEPYSYTPKKLFANVGVNLIKNTNVKVGYEFSSIARKEGEEDEGKSDENAVKISLDSALADWLSVRLGYRHAKREWSLEDKKITYGGAFKFRRYHEANRDRDAFDILFDISPIDKLDVSLSYAFGKDKYPKSDYGLKYSDFYTASIDFDYALSEVVSLFAFYSYENYKSEQAARQSGAVYSTNPLDDWSAKLTDIANTFGGGVNTSLKKDRVFLYLYYTYSKVKGDSDLYSPPGGTPDVAANFSKGLDTTTLHSAKVKLLFKHSEHFATTIGYWYEQYDLEDIVREDMMVDVQGASGGIYLGASEPAYKYHIAFVNFICSW